VNRPTTQEYWDQVASYAEMAIDLARSDFDKLKELIDSLDSLPEQALTDTTGHLSSKLLTNWIDSVKGSLEESGHLDVGLQKAGEVFIYSPADPDGLFMSHAVASVLNRDDMEELRHGYSIAVYNFRGVHVVDPTGAPEKQLSFTYGQRADAVENAGYHRLAVTLRAIADGYTREAEHVMARSAAEHRHNQE